MYKRSLHFLSALADHTFDYDYTALVLVTVLSGINYSKLYDDTLRYLKNILTVINDQLS